MRITFKELVTDPVYPIMHGNTPAAKEFNKRQKALWKQGKEMADFKGITTVLLEILIDDYNERNSFLKKEILQLKELKEQKKKSSKK
jgi:hypothetical protein